MLVLFLYPTINTLLGYPKIATLESAEATAELLTRQRKELPVAKVWGWDGAGFMDVTMAAVTLW